MKIKTMTALLIFTSLMVSCTPAIYEIPSLTATAAQTSTSTTVPPTITPAPTATIVIERWMEYEYALAKEILSTSTAICEWEILGQENQEVYVWAMCQMASSAQGSAASVPAVIYLDSDSNIESVQIPGDGPYYARDIQKLFPQELQDLIFQGPASIDEMWSHIGLRQKNPEPPLIVLSGVTLP